MGKVKFESEVDRSFTEEILSEPGGEAILKCIQCGTCSSTCPLSHFMDYTPRQIIYMVREGFKKEVLSSRTLWICASCFSCVVQCPSGIKIADVMHIIKRKAMAEGVYPKDEFLPKLYKSFYESVKASGRINETNVVRKASLGKALGMLGLGLKLRGKGRLSLAEESVKDVSQVRKLIEEAEKA